MYFPFLIEAGMVYRAVAPLYSIKEGKKKKYFTENVDFVKYIQKLFINDNDLKNIKNKPLSNNDITRLLLNNIEYVYFLEKISNTYAVDPYLLEMVLNITLSLNMGRILVALPRKIMPIYKRVQLYIGAQI